MVSTHCHVIVIGAGIGGLTAPLSLQRHGFRVSVYEQASEFKEFGAGLPECDACTRISGSRRVNRIKRVREAASICWDEAAPAGASCARQTPTSSTIRLLNLIFRLEPLLKQQARKNLQATCRASGVEAGFVDFWSFVPWGIAALRYLFGRAGFGPQRLIGGVPALSESIIRHVQLAAGAAHEWSP
jgi:hypothetical protein